MHKYFLWFFVTGIIAALFYLYSRSYWVPVYQKIVGTRTVTDVVNHIGLDVRRRLRPMFEKVGENYPPAQVTLLAIKDTAMLELWVNHDKKPVQIVTYPIQALSGVAGPKLREGDRQVPEGIYAVDGLNPNSSYHLSMKLNYPNDFDLKNARSEGRVNPGSNIFIHGKALSIGCLAMGDKVIEELFILAADVGRENFNVVIAPTDPRVAPLEFEGKPGWVKALYIDIDLAFKPYWSP